MEDKIETTTAQATPSAEDVKTTVLGETKVEETKVEPPKEEPKTETTGETKAPETKVEEKIVPEVYELKLPEGALLSAARLEEISNFAKSKKLSQEDAQTLVERENAVVADYAKAQSDSFEASKAAWFEEAKNDPEIGGENFAKSAESNVPSSLTSLTVILFEPFTELALVFIRLRYSG